MAFVYPLEMPKTIGLGSVVMRTYNSVSSVKNPFTLATQLYEYPGQAWGGTLTIPPVRRELAAEWKAFLTKLKGQRGTFVFWDPDYYEPQGLTLGERQYWIDEETSEYVTTEEGEPIYYNEFSYPTVSSAASSGADRIFLDFNHKVTSGYALVQGDYIQLGSGAGRTLHHVLNDVDTSLNNVAYVDIWPSLRRNLNVGEVVVLDRPSGIFKLVNNSQEWSIDNISKYGLSLDFEEYISV